MQGLPRAFHLFFRNKFNQFNNTGAQMLDNLILKLLKNHILCENFKILPSFMQRCNGSDSFTILGLWVLGLAVSHINESNCKLMSPEHYF